MNQYGAILIGSILVNNLVLVKFLGLCPLIGVSRRREMALGLSLATSFVLILASISSYAIENGLLRPLGIEYLRTLVYIVLIASLVQLTEMVTRKVSPLLFRTLGVYLPLITTNCAVLGLALLNSQSGYDFIGSLLHGIGAALGFTLVMILFSGLRERLEVADVPLPFRGHSIGLITAGLVSLAFMGFAGLVKG